MIRKKYILGRSKSRRRRAIKLIGGSLLCLAVIISGLVLTRERAPTNAKITGQNISAASTAQPVINYGLPVEIRIPKITVKAKVVYLGTTKTGNMDIPKDIAETGWYKGGALPGNNGTSVIAGHLSGRKGEPGVFSQLDKLEAGDEVLVTDSNKQAIAYVVREKRNYNQDDQPSEVFNSTSGSHLNLITCSGDWDKELKGFTKRLVIFTDKVN